MWASEAILSTKEHFFVSRLVVFNETFASMNEEVDFAVLGTKELREDWPPMLHLPTSNVSTFQGRTQ